MRAGIGLLASVFLLGLSAFAYAAEPTVEVQAGAETRSFTRDELLARTDAATIKIPDDSSYRMPMHYRAVPAAALLSGLDFPPGSVIEAVATDGFAAQIPVDLMLNTDPQKSVAWIAIEPADAPWPNLPGKKTGAGPFYIVWTKPDASSIHSEYWAYGLAKLVSQSSPAARWPGLAVDPSLPADDPARAGFALFVAQCLPCHKLNGGGASNVGPDLNLPMNPTEYLTETGLRALIRNPKSVRTWPEQSMPGFNLSEAEIGGLIAYLKHMAGRKAAP